MTPVLIPMLLQIVKSQKHNKRPLFWHITPHPLRGMQFSYHYIIWDIVTLSTKKLSSRACFQDIIKLLNMQKQWSSEVLWKSVLKKMHESHRRTPVKESIADFFLSVFGKIFQSNYSRGNQWTAVSVCIAFYHEKK